MTDLHLSIENLSLAINQRSILQNVNFNLREGEIGCLLGPSGCGKTSLLRIIAGLEERAKGKIKLSGRKLLSEKIFVKPQHRKIGMVFQDYSLFPHLSVKENIMLGLDHLNSVDRSKKCEEMLAIVKLSHKTDNYPHQLSGGEQQRIALARALAQEPTLLLLDEPFSNLDAQLRTNLAEDIRQILIKLKMTAILVTHDQSEAFSFADSITVLNHGQVEQSTTAKDLYQRPLNTFVAHFIGEGVIVDGKELSMALNNNQLFTGSVLIRPEQIFIDAQADLKTIIVKKAFAGPFFNYELKMNNLHLQYKSRMEYELGTPLNIKIDLENVVSLKG